MNVSEDFKRYYQLCNQRSSSFVATLNVFRSPGFQAVLVYRFSHWSIQSKIRRVLLSPIRSFANFLIKTLWGIQIGYPAKIGPGLYIGHFGGIIISGRTKMGSGVSLSQGVTIGMTYGQDGGCPELGDHIYIGPGAVIFGKIQIGSHSKIGANAVIHKSIPPGSTAVAWPGFKLLETNEEFDGI